MSPQHPEHGLITNCALQMEDRMLAMIRPMCCHVGPNNAGGQWPLSVMLLLCKGLHTYTLWSRAKQSAHCGLRAGDSALRSHHVQDSRDDSTIDVPNIVAALPARKTDTRRRRTHTPDEVGVRDLGSLLMAAELLPKHGSGLAMCLPASQAKNRRPTCVALDRLDCGRRAPLD